MKKTIVIAAATLLSMISQAQTNSLPDTMSAADKALLKTLGSFMQAKAKEFFQQDRDSRSLKNTLANTLKKTLQQSLESSMPGFSNPKTFLDNPLTAIELPKQLQQSSDQFLQKGKADLLNNLKSAVNEAASNALQNGFTKVMENIVTMDLDSLLTLSSRDSGLSMTDVFRLSKLDKLQNTLAPLAETAFKAAGGEKMMRKVEKFYNRNNDSTLNLNIQDFITNGAIQSLTNLMNKKELELKSNPLPLIEGLLNSLFKQ
jgi:hypothetical protein